ncbi:MAG: hypothetical protein QXS37_04780 [Candidatus Aenigmatarchaeota archaeon]
MTKIKVPVTGMDNSYVEVPAHDHLSKVQASTDYLHGDGFWPIYQDKMAKVEPGNGLTVLINDYFALIDGYKVGYRGIKELNWNQKVTLDVSSAVGKDPVYIALKAGRDEKGVKCNKEGIFFLIEQEPNERGVFSLPDGDAIPVARLKIPAGTTQITEDMIDNSVKKWLADIDKAIANLKNYVYCKVEEAKREVFKWILEEFKPEIIDMIAQGDEAVKAELNQKIFALQTQVNNLSISIEELRSSFSEFMYYVNKKIEELETISQELQEVISKTQDRLSKLEVDVQKLFEKDDQLISLINSLDVRISNLESSGPSNDQSLAFAVDMLFNEVSWLRWQNQAMTNALVFGISKKGFSDVFKDLGWVDLTRSGNIELIPTFLGVGTFPLNIPEKAYLARYFNYMAYYVTTGRTSDIGNPKTFVEDWNWLDARYPSLFTGMSPNGNWIIRDAYGFNNLSCFLKNSTFYESQLQTLWTYMSTVAESTFLITNGPCSFDWYPEWDAKFSLSIGWQFSNQHKYYVLRFGVGYNSRITLAIANQLAIEEVLYSTTDIYIPPRTTKHLVISKISNDDGTETFKIEGLSTTPIEIIVPADRVITQPGELVFALINSSTIDNTTVEGYEALRVDSADLISVAYQTDEVPSKVYFASEYDGNITFYVSRDDGQTWEEVSPYTIHTFGNVPEGQLLRYKATLTKGSKLYAVYLAYI